MSRPLPPTRFVLSLFHTPSAETFATFHSVVRAGHLVGGPEHHIAREHYPGQELIFCLRGTGEVRLRSRRWPVTAGQLAWIDCGHPHEFRAAATDPWEVYWLRFDGPQANGYARRLRVAECPVFEGFPRRPVRALFERVFALIQQPAGGQEGWLNAEVARLVAWLFEARQQTGLGEAAGQSIPERLRRPLENLRLYYHRPWRVPELAAQAGMSPSHFFRIFKQHLGTSPHEWLRRERITHAKRQLIETDEAIKQVAVQCGYSDQFFFSRDFKQVTGLTPTDFRRRERGRPSAPPAAPT